MIPARKNDPDGGIRAADISCGDESILAGPLDLTTAAARVAGVHVVVVEAGAGKYRRRCFFNLPGAQRAADRAIMDGHPARVVLCQLVPVSGGGK